VAKKPKRKKTELGRTLAKVRIDFDETGADMAKKLGISASQMFNIEVGLAQVGYEFIGKIKEIYGVDLAEIMQRGGFMSKITLDLDELSKADKDTVLEIWTRRLTGEPPPPADKVTLVEPVVPIVVDVPVPVSRKRRPPTLDSDVGFLDEVCVDDLEGLEEADVL